MRGIFILSSMGNNMSYLDSEELLTKRELIGKIMDNITDQLWSSDNDAIMEFAKTVGIDVVGHTSGNLFWKSVEEKT